MTLRLRLAHALQCALCRRLRDNQRVADDITEAALFGVKAYAQCPCCHQAVPYDWIDAPWWHRKVDRWMQEK